MSETRPPLPPFTRETAVQKVRGAEDAWNSCNPERVSLAYTPDSNWRNRSEFIRGRAEIVAFLTRKWAKELDYRLIKELWAFAENRIAVRFAYEWHDDSGNWFRSYGNENWEFAENGLMRRRLASINDLSIKDADGAAARQSRQPFRAGFVTVQSPAALCNAQWRHRRRTRDRHFLIVHVGRPAPARSSMSMRFVAGSR